MGDRSGLDLVADVIAREDRLSMRSYARLLRRYPGVCFAAKLCGHTNIHLFQGDSR